MNTDVERARSYAISRSYSFDSSPQNPNYAGISEADWRAMIESTIQSVYDSGHVEFMAYIYHDRDKDDNGGIVPIHCHVLVRFKQSHEREDVGVMFGVTRKNNCQPVDNHLGTARYLIHISKSAIEDEKVMYSADEVVCFDCRYKDLIKESFWKTVEKKSNELQLVKSRQQAEAIADNLGKQIRDGEIRRHEAVELLEEQAGYSWVRKLSHTFDVDQQAFMKAEVENLTENGRNLKNIFVMGHGGIGKTVFARKYGLHLAQGKGIKMAASAGKSKTPDVLDGYTDEQVVILNEISSSSFELDEFNDVFDKHSYTPFPSRHENKDFIGDTFIFTNSVSPLRFAKDMVIYSKGGSQYQDVSNKKEIDPNTEGIGKYWQVRRRFKSFVVLLRDENNADYVNAYVFKLRESVRLDNGLISNDNGTHILVGHVPFKAIPNTEPEITSDVLREVERLMSIDVSNVYDNITEIDRFLEDNGIVEAMKDDSITAFIDEVIDECVWDLLPNNFVWDLFKEYQRLNNPADERVNRSEFLEKLSLALDGDVWEWAKDNAVRSSGRMDLDEPLITEYDLERWQSKGYSGGNMQMKRNFNRKERYTGFVRK